MTPPNHIAGLNRILWENAASPCMLSRRDHYWKNWLVRWDPDFVTRIAVREANRLVGSIAKTMAANNPWLDILTGGKFYSSAQQRKRRLKRILSKYHAERPYTRDELEKEQGPGRPGPCVAAKG